MSIFKKMLFISSVITTPVLATVLTSCSIINTFDKTLAEQIKLLTSDEAKKIYENNWSREAFAKLFLQSETKTSIAELNEKEVAAVKDFLLDFKIKPDFPSTIAGKNTTTLLNEIKASLLETFKFYTSWKSFNNISYFIDQKEVWLETLKDEDKNAINDHFKPGPYYHFNGPSHLAEFEENFNLLYSIIGTNIQNEILNMKVAELYFTSANSEIIQRGTNYNEIIDGDQNSLNYWETTSFDIDSPTYFLEKYLVNKAPKIKWNYASDDFDQIVDWTNRPIKNINDYASLWNGFEESEVSDRIFSSDLVVKSNDGIFNNNILKVRGYNPAIELSGASISGDLSTNTDDMRTFINTKSGLINKNDSTGESLLMSFDQLDKVNQIREINKDVVSAYLAPITLKKLSSSTRKKSYQITADDLLISGSPFLNNTFSQGHNIWKIEAITPLLNSQNEAIEINMSYSFDNGVTKIEDYKYKFTITWEQTPSPDSAKIVSELSEPFEFSDRDFNTSFGKNNINGVNPIVEDKVNVTYYMRLSPNFKWLEDGSGVKEVKKIEDKDKAIGHFTMDGTPWDKNTNPNNLRQLVFTLFMNDYDNLIKEIKSVLVLNDIALIPGDIKEVNDLLHEIGILYIKDKPDYAKPKILG